MTPILPGDVIIAEFRNADGTFKRRPAIVLKIIPPFGDFLVCGLSTQLHQRAAELDETIVSTDDDYWDSGLLDDSLIRLGYLTMLSEYELDGAIGEISHARLVRLLHRLSNFFKPSS